jgi:hypothetical protein
VIHTPVLLSAADGHRLASIALSVVPNGESRLNDWFRRCSSVVDGSNVIEFA